MSIFKRNQKKVWRSIKKMDAIITWLVLWWIVASVYWIKKHEYDKEKAAGEHKEDEKIEKTKKGHMDMKSIIKALVFGFEEKEEIKSKSFLSRLFSLFWRWKK